MLLFVCFLCLEGPKNSCIHLEFLFELEWSDLKFNVSPIVLGEIILWSWRPNIFGCTSPEMVAVCKQKYDMFGQKHQRNDAGHLTGVHFHSPELGGSNTSHLLSIDIFTLLIYRRVAFGKHNHINQNKNKNTDKNNGFSKHQESPLEISKRRSQPWYQWDRAIWLKCWKLTIQGGVMPRIFPTVSCQKWHRFGGQRWGYFYRCPTKKTDF